MKLILLSALLAQTSGAGVVEGQGFEIDPLRESLSAVGLLALGITLDREKLQWYGQSPCERKMRKLTPKNLEAFEAMADDDGLCEAQPLPFFDQWVTGQNSEFAAKLSDYALISLVLAPFAFSAIDVPVSGRPAENLGIDALVSLQTIGATLLAVQIVKVATSRPRPLTYNRHFGKEIRFDGDSRLSFPSGHAAISFSAASLVSVMLLDRYGLNLPTALSVVGLYGGAASVALMRTLAGKHFVSDVLAGAAIGTLFGLALPIFHLKEDRDQSKPLSNAGGRPQPLMSIGFSF